MQHSYHTLQLIYVHCITEQLFRLCLPNWKQSLSSMPQFAAHIGHLSQFCRDLIFIQVDLVQRIPFCSPYVSILELSVNDWSSAPFTLLHCAYHTNYLKLHLDVA